MWRARFGRGFGPVVRQTAKWINKNKQDKRELTEISHLKIKNQIFM
jgi:hypothetical protein